MTLMICANDTLASAPHSSSRLSSNSISRRRPEPCLAVPEALYSVDGITGKLMQEL